jgi:hypothetical protein
MAMTISAEKTAINFRIVIPSLNNALLESGPYTLGAPHGNGFDWGATVQGARMRSPPSDLFFDKGKDERIVSRSST